MENKAQATDLLNEGLAIGREGCGRTLSVGRVKYKRIQSPSTNLACRGGVADALVATQHHLVVADVKYAADHTASQDAEKPATQQLDTAQIVKGAR